MNRDWVNEQGHRTKKTPTSLLLKPDLSFDSFGYKAEEKYCNLKNVYEEKEYWFFQHFKMCLHNDEVSVLETVTLFPTKTKTNKQTNKKRTHTRTRSMHPNKQLLHSCFQVWMKVATTYTKKKSNSL